MEHSAAGYFTADHVRPKKDATTSQRPAELEDIERSSSDLSEMGRQESEVDRECEGGSPQVVGLKHLNAFIHIGNLARIRHSRAYDVGSHLQLMKLGVKGLIELCNCC